MRVWIAIWTGSSAISRGIAAWIAGGPLLRLVLVVIAAGFVKGLPWTTNLAWLLAAAWLATAVMLGLRLPDPTAPAPQPSTEDQEQPAPTPAGITREQLVQALHQVGAPHAHFTALADHLEASTDAVKEALAEARIPTSGGVRMKGRRVAVSPGVKAADFPPLPSPADEGAPEGPLTSNNNDNNNGRDFELIPDKENPARTHVRWLRR